MADINQITIGGSTYDIDAKTINGKNITVSTNTPTASDGADGDLWFAPSTGGGGSGGLSPIEMTVTGSSSSRTVEITETGLYLCIMGPTYDCNGSSSYAHRGTSLISIDDLTQNHNGTNTKYSYWSTNSEATEDSGRIIYYCDSNRLRGNIRRCFQLLKY